MAVEAPPLPREAEARPLEEATVAPRALTTLLRMGVAEEETTPTISISRLLVAMLPKGDHPVSLGRCHPDRITTAG